MKITCWGARGSIPVSGADYLKYGGDTSCVEVRSRNNDVIIIDAGTGIRKLGNRLIASEQRTFNLLFTHAHWDHLMGFPFFKPVYMKGMMLNLYGCPSAQQSIGRIIAQTMAAPYFPVDFGQVPAEIVSHDSCEESFEIGPISVTSIPLSHPNQGQGYKFSEDGKQFVFLTDNELTLRHPGGGEFGDYLRFSEGADLLLHDAEYTAEQYGMTKGWGHSVYTDALRLALDAGVKKFGLFHHNQDRTDAELDRLVDDCRRIVKEQRSGLECFAAEPGIELVL